MIKNNDYEKGRPVRVVLIGARGFIGAALHRRLQGQGIAVLALGSAELNLAEAGAAGRLAAMVQPDDAIVMLAALTPDKGRDVATLMKNLAMMQNVCAAIEKTGCAQFVYVSSDAVYPFTQGTVSEDTAASPNDLYGAMHHTREVMARGLAKIPVLALRPTLVYGIDDTHNAYGPNRLRRMAQKERKITLFGSGEETRDHIHVDDVAAVLVRCLQHRSSGTLNVATGVSKSFHEVAELVARQFADKIEIVATPRQNPVTHRHYDITDLIKAFPDFRFIPLEEGIARVHNEMMRNASKYIPNLIPTTR
jgi:nucleoside-diphosphate-sugar epimerase